MRPKEFHKKNVGKEFSSALLNDFRQILLGVWFRFLMQRQKDSPSEIGGGADNYLSILLAIASYWSETLVSISSSGPGYPLSLPEWNVNRSCRFLFLRRDNRRNCTLPCDWNIPFQGIRLSWCTSWFQSLIQQNRNTYLSPEEVQDWLGSADGQELLRYQLAIYSEPNETSQYRLFHRSRWWCLPSVWSNSRWLALPWPHRSWRSGHRHYLIPRRHYHMPSMIKLSLMTQTLKIINWWTFS